LGVLGCLVFGPNFTNNPIFVVGVSIGLLVLFRTCWNHQGRLAKELAADVYTVYLIHAPVLVGFAYDLHVVAL
jgi:Mg2+/citrate symporter